MTDPNTDQQALLDQIRELQTEVAKLRTALQQTDPMERSRAGLRTKMGAGGGMGDQGEMGGMGGMMGGGMGTGQNRGMSQGSGGGMGMMGMMEDSGEMGGGMGTKRAQGQMGGMMSGMGGMMGDMMGSDRGMGGMTVPPSAMPGQPGASHLYHIGSTGFFLDHAKHIALTPEQTKTLNRLKEKALLDRTTAQRRIDQVEQDLYILTGADEPDAVKIQAKVAEIEKLRADQRMTFIRAVGEATKVLTHDQHRALLGTMTSTQK
ncbi:MAG: periplasmic heavy metal sensor [Nitrospira sp.]|nr:periplasmic heavy metal sensor [Nitrospira sp.]